MTDPAGAFERSLRDGPPDERGYRPRPLDLAPREATDTASRTALVSPVVTIGGGGRASARSIWRYIAAAVAMVLVVGVAAIGIGLVRERSVASTPAPTETTPAIPVPPLTETFTSNRNGFTVRHPAGWEIKQATAAWPLNFFLPNGNPALDQIMLRGAARLTVASQPLEAGQTETDWLDAFFHPYQGAQACDIERSKWAQLVIDGRSGYLDAKGCTMGADGRIADRDVWFDALVFDGGRVYKISLDGDVDLDYFKAILATIQLEPLTAVD